MITINVGGLLSSPSIMAVLLTRRAVRSLPYILALLVLFSIILAIILPYDHSWRLRVRFELDEASSRFTIPASEQTWYFKHPKNPVNFDSDVGLIIKTSYGREQHVVAQLQTLGYNGKEEGVIIVSDAEQELNVGGHELQVLDVIGSMLEENKINEMGETLRAAKYHELAETIATGRDQVAIKLSQSYNQILDTMKYVPALERAHNSTVKKKWWVVIDDDTLLLNTSLEKLLARLDPRKDQYIGSVHTNPRFEQFAHGESAIVISQRTLAHLFERPDIVMGAKIDSIRGPPGDVIIAVALIRLGVYINERFSPFFNQLQPKYTRVNADNFCVPLVNFHGFGTEENLVATASMVRQYGERMVYNGAIWSILREPNISGFSTDPVRPGHDHVGHISPSHDTKPDPASPSKTYANVDSALDCLSKCDRSWKQCLAWTWIEETKDCHLASWVIVGDEVEGRYSGLHYSRAKEIGDRCIATMKKAGCYEPGASCGI